MLRRMRTSNRVVFGAVAAVFLVLSLVAVLLKPDFDYAVSDGWGYYVYLPSVVIDGDVDFTNQILEHRVDEAYRLRLLTPLGLPANKYPAGVALTLLPAFTLAHVVARVGHSLTGLSALAPDGYSPPYQLLALLTVLGLGVATMALLDRLLTKSLDVGPRASRVAVLLFWIGSNYAYHYFREPLMAHAISTFWVTASICVMARLSIERGAERSPLLGPALAFSLVMAVVCRPTNAFLVSFLPLLRGGASGSEGPPRVVWPAYAAAALPLVAQVSIWKALFGDWIVYSYGDEGFNWGSPLLIETLLSPRHGLFVWSPLLLFSFLGLWVGRHRWSREQRSFVVALIAAFLALWYLNSAWSTWWFGDAFGGRAFLEMAAFFVVGLALWVERLDVASGWKRWAGVWLLGATVAYSWILMMAYIAHRISRDGPLF